MTPGGLTVLSPATGCQFPLASRNICHPGVGPPSARQVWPAGQLDVLQSCDVVTEQRRRRGIAGVTAFSGFTISMPVTCTRRRVIGVGSRGQPATIVFPTLLGSTPFTGVVMSTS